MFDEEAFVRGFAEDACEVYSAYDDRDLPHWEFTPVFEVEAEMAAEAAAHEAFEREMEALDREVERPGKYPIGVKAEEEERALPTILSNLRYDDQYHKTSLFKTIKYRGITIALAVFSIVMTLQAL